MNRCGEQGPIFVLSMGGLQHAESFLVCIKGSVNIGERMNHVGFQKKMQRKNDDDQVQSEALMCG